MAKNRKIKRNTKIYRRHRKSSKMILFILFILAAVALGFFGTMVLKEAWDKAKEENSSNTSQTSSEENSSDNSNLSSQPDESQASSDSSQGNEESGFQAAVMPNDILFDETARQSFLTETKQSGKTAVVVELKDENGILYFQSSNALAAQYSAVSPQALDAKVLCQSIVDAGLTPIARISTLKDPVVSRLAAGTTYQYQGGNENSWLDAALNQGGKTWLNPYQENARKYLTSLSLELAQAGFKTIILNDFYFPSAADQSMGIAGQTVSRSDILKQLYDEIEQAVAAQGAQAVVQLPANAYFGVDEFRYGGSPDGLGLEQVVVDFNQNALPQGAEALNGIDMNNSAAVMEALLGQIMAGGANVIPYADGQTDYHGVLASKELKSFIAE